MQKSLVPDKIAYTKGEKIADILSIIFCIASAAVQIVLFAAAIFGPSAIFTCITTLLVGAAFTFVSLYPQHTNIFQNKKDVTEQMFRKLRKQAIVAKLILSAIIFLIVLL